MWTRSWVLFVLLPVLGRSTPSQLRLSPYLTEDEAELIASRPPSYYFRVAEQDSVDLGDVELAYRWKASESERQTTRAGASVLVALGVTSLLFGENGFLSDSRVALGVGSTAAGLMAYGSAWRNESVADKYETWAEIVYLRRIENGSTGK